MNWFLLMDNFDKKFEFGLFLILRSQLYASHDFLFFDRFVSFSFASTLSRRAFAYAGFASLL